MDPELQEYLLIAGVAVSYVIIPFIFYAKDMHGWYKLLSRNPNQPATMDTPMNKTVHINYEPNTLGDLEESL